LVPQWSPAPNGIPVGGHAGGETQLPCGVATDVELATFCVPVRGSDRRPA
jgi:hypothetical protein